MARQRATGLGPGADLREGDAEHLPFDEASFDTVTCALSLCTILSPAAAIGEMRRVLVPGGRLLLLDHIASTWPPLSGSGRTCCPAGSAEALPRGTWRTPPDTSAGTAASDLGRLD